MVEIIIKNPGNTDKKITLVRNPIQYTVPAGGQIIIKLDDPEKDSIVLE